MSKYNELISDAEIRELLNMVVLDDQVLNEQLITMEARIVFAGEPAIIPPLHMEQKLVSKLGTKFAARTGLKWLFTGIGVASAVTYIAIEGYRPAKHSAQQALPARHATELAIADTAVADVPSDTVKDTGKHAFAGAYPADEIASPEPLGMKKHSPVKPFEALPPVEPIRKNMGNRIMNRTENGDAVSIDTLFKGVKRLEVHAMLCDVTVEATNTETVTVKGQLKTEMKGIYSKKADFGFFYERKDDILKVWIENKGGKNILFAGVVNYNGFLNFVVPEGTDMVLHNSSGSIRAKGLRGKVCEAQTSYGDIHMTDIKVPMTLQAASGNISVQKSEGDIVAGTGYGDQNFTDVTGLLKVQSASGNVKAENHTGGLSVVCNYGDIDIRKLKGDIRIVSLSGNIEISDMAGVQCHITSNYGNIRLDKISASTEIECRSGHSVLSGISGDLIVKSWYGNQDFSGIKGNITAKSSSGHIKLSNCEGNMSLSLSYGDANLSDCKGDLKVSSASGDIKGSNLEITEKMDLAATYGNVRMTLKNRIDDLSFNLSTVWGHIDINKEGVRKSDDKRIVIEQGRIRVKVVTTSGNQVFD